MGEPAPDPVVGGDVVRRGISLPAGYVAIALLVVVASIWAPATLSGPAFNSIAPFGTFLAITALGQMLVIMTGGIDLSVPGTFTLAAVVTVGSRRVPTIDSGPRSVLRLPWQPWWG